MAKVLLVANEMTLVQMIGELLRGEGHSVLPFTNGSAALQALPTVMPELVLADLSLDKNGVPAPGLLPQARSLSPPAVVIMITPPGAAAWAVESMKKGAYDYMEKPFAPDELKLRVQRALAYHTALAENEVLRRQMDSRLPSKEVVGTSPALQSVLQLAVRVADLDCPVLLCGEKGSGKKLIARTIHANSRRRLGPFVTVHCSALPENLLESELFGTKKGLFPTGSDEKLGVLQEVQGGTVLLEGIEGLPLSLQERLFEWLRTREKAREANPNAAGTEARILAAANEPLETKALAGSFRQDLYQQLSALLIQLPTLRDRKEDIPLLISHFLDGKRDRRAGRPLEMGREALDACGSYPWPGNVRELQQAVERACVLASENLIQLSDLPPAVQRLAGGTEQAMGLASSTGHSGQNGHPPQNGQNGQNGHNGTGSLQPLGAVGRLAECSSCGLAQGIDHLMPLKKFLRDQELNYLHRTLAQVGGSKERAAELLGISLATIYRKLSEPESF